MLSLQASASNQTNWGGCSQVVATYCADITGAFTILLPVEPPSDAEFCPVVTWVEDGVVRRFKLFAGVGEVLPLEVYAGETIHAPASIEIWNTQAHNPTTVPAWSITLGLLENPTTDSDVTGTVYTCTLCVPTFVIDSLETLVGECPNCS